MSKSYSVAEARNSLADLIDQVQTGKSVEITRRGKPVAVIVSTAEFTNLKQRGRRKKGLWQVILQMRSQPGFVGIEKADLDFESLRDRSVGRETSWPT